MTSVDALSVEHFAASMIVPTRNRADYLRRFLPSWAEQTVGEPYEVIVADNDSTDETATLVREPHVRLVSEPRKGGARARHAGARAARSPVLLFVDDDMRAEPNLVAEHLRAQGESPGVVLGNIISAPGRHPFDRMMAYIYDGPKRSLAAREPSAHDYWSGNVSIARELYFRLGGYSDVLAELRCGEDMEFGLRMTAAGVSMRFAPGALTHHHFDDERFAARLNRSYRIGVAWAYLKEKYPDLQTDTAPPARGRWRPRALELACRVFARVAEPFDRGEGVPCVPLAYVYALGVKTATGRGIADYFAGRTPLKERLKSGSVETTGAGPQAQAGVAGRSTLIDGQGNV
jgi:GT2 family glycosyltransferase